MNKNKKFFSEKAPELLSAFENIKERGVFTMVRCSGLHFEGVDIGNIEVTISGIIQDNDVPYVGTPISCFIDFPSVIEKIKEFTENGVSKIAHFRCSIESKPWKGGRRKFEGKFVTPSGTEYKINFMIGFDGRQNKR